MFEALRKESVGAPGIVSEIGSITLSPMQEEVPQTFFEFSQEKLDFLRCNRFGL